MENNLSLSEIIIDKQFEENKNIEEAKKCFGCQKDFDLSFWNRVKTTFTRDKPIECINCGEVFCSNCYKNEARYSRKNPNKKGYSCNKCLEETKVDNDVLFLPVNTVKDSLDDVKSQLLELKNIAEPVLNDKVIPLLNDTKELVLSTQKTVDDAKKYLPALSEKLNLILNNTLTVINKSQEKVENIPNLVQEIKKLNSNFSKMLILLVFMIVLLFLGEILIIYKLIFV